MKDEVITRMSIQYGMVSMTGKMKNNPGPLRAWKRPSRKTTARFH